VLAEANAVADAARQQDVDVEMSEDLTAETRQNDAVEAELEALDVASNTVLLQASVEMHRRTGVAELEL